ncbi:small, acid-soluble spore protein L [Bacillus sp. FJAT-29790]|nr:small, acid-soluble spore protein L [Bacillus sp. FJAT-29790]MBU8879018.1 small, acid-soluble spore protein L [Bacillus sp. FJAT-29790]
MGKRKQKNRGKTASGVNPQGYGQDTEFAAEEPKSKLENAVKKKNTK